MGNAKLPESRLFGYIFHHTATLFRTAGATVRAGIYILLLSNFIKKNSRYFVLTAKSYAANRFSRILQSGNHSKTVPNLLPKVRRVSSLTYSSHFFSGIQSTIEHSDGLDTTYPITRWIERNGFSLS